MAKCGIRNFDPWKAADTSVREAIHRHRKGAKVEGKWRNGAMDECVCCLGPGRNFQIFD